MKKRSLLSKQNITKKPKSRRPIFRDLFRFVTSVFFKVSVLIVGMVSVSLLFLFLYKSLVTSSYVKVEKIEITGVDDAMKGELINIAGLNKNLSLLTLNPNEIKAKMEKHPWIRSVELEKQFPHTLIIRAEKETPRALVAFDKLCYMNKEGKVFKELSKDDDIDYPVITGVSKTADNAKEKLALAVGILDIFDSETGTCSLQDISEIHVNDGGDALIYSISLPVAIRMGGENLQEEKKRLKTLVAYLQSSGGINAVSIIDMSYHEGAVVSYKEQDNSNVSEKKDIKTSGINKPVENIKGKG